MPVSTSTKSWPPTMNPNRYRRITFNISGETFETFEKTLKRFPSTLLGNAEKRRHYYCVETGKYYFNRNKQSFESILFFYQSNGTLLCPDGMRIELFVDDCNFYQLPDESIYRMKLKAGIIPELQEEDDDYITPVTKQGYLWNVLEYPGSSKTAQVFMIVSMSAIVLSILLTIMESHKSLRPKSKKLSENPLTLAELALNTFFLIEFIARIISVPSKKTFFMSCFTWIDASSILPYFIQLIVNRNVVNSLGFFRILRLVRIFRVFRLSKKSRRLKIIGKILSYSFDDLQSLLLSLLLIVILLGSIMYYIENSLESDFSSIPDALWWAIITILTIGYGDIIPMSIAGRLFAGFLMLFGAATISLPILSIVARFELFYKKNMEEQETRQEEKEMERYGGNFNPHKAIMAQRRPSNISYDRTFSMTALSINTRPLI